MKGFIAQEKRSKSIYVLLVIVTSTMNKTTNTITKVRVLESIVSNKDQVYVSWIGSGMRMM